MYIITSCREKCGGLLRESRSSKSRAPESPENHPKVPPKVRGQVQERQLVQPRVQGPQEGDDGGPRSGQEPLEEFA